MSLNLDPPADRLLLNAICRGAAKIGVIGLGYVGLPLVRAFVDAGFSTIGFDTDQSKVDQLAAGKTYIKHIPPEWVADSTAAQRFRPTSETSQLAEPDVLVICVPTPLTPDRTPDLSYVENTARQISATLRRGQLVILESTTYPSTTRTIVLPILSESGLQCGVDYFLAYSPEREDPGNTQYDTRKIPRVVGGIDQASTDLTVALYRRAVVDVVPVSSAEVAEACKILENTYRAVNIALVNELKTLFDRMDIDIWEVIEAAKTKPFGFQAFYPGPGLGGHCIPIDPFYLSWLARSQGMSTQFIELAGEVNASMPAYVVDKVSHVLNAERLAINGSKIAILGVAYKPNVDDPRESPAFRIMELLEDLGAQLTYHDPQIAKLPKMRNYRVPSLSSESLTADYLAAQDCVIIVTDHSDLDWQLVVDHAQRVIDTRGATRHITVGREKIHPA